MNLQAEFKKLDRLSRKRSLTHGESLRLESVMRQLGMIEKKGARA